MKADVFYDELGKDMRVEPIPENMLELAEGIPHKASRSRFWISTKR